MITAALATLPFLGALWLIVVLGVEMMRDSGPKIIAALKGETIRYDDGNRPERRVRVRMRTSSATRAAATARVAA